MELIRSRTGTVHREEEDYWFKPYCSTSTEIVDRVVGVNPKDLENPGELCHNCFDPDYGIRVPECGHDCEVSPNHFACDDCGYRAEGFETAEDAYLVAISHAKMVNDMDFESPVNSIRDVGEGEVVCFATDRGHVFHFFIKDKFFGKGSDYKNTVCNHTGVVVKSERVRDFDYYESEKSSTVQKYHDGHLRIGGKKGVDFSVECNCWGRIYRVGVYSLSWSSADAEFEDVYTDEEQAKQGQFPNGDRRYPME